MAFLQSPRQLIVVLLLCMAAIAAVVRHFAEPGTGVHDVASVMMVLWLPVIGSIIAWCIGQLRRAPPAAPPGFAPDSAFQPHASVEFMLRPALVPAEDVPVQPGEHRCVFVVGHQGFQGRWQVASGETLRRGETSTRPVEFLSPQLALAQLPPGTPFRMLVGEAFVGDGRVLELLAPG